MVGGELKGGRYGEMICGEVFRRDNILGIWWVLVWAAVGSGEAKKQSSCLSFPGCHTIEKLFRRLDKCNTKILQRAGMHLGF